jgi:tetratricopeptide (TPR) repeat protein
MNIGYVFLALIAGMAYFVTNVPTPDEMVANFNAAQKFYTSGAYDQALETYNDVSEVESSFMDEEAVTVEFFEMEIPIREAATYKSGQTYFKMIQEENRMASEAETDEEMEKHSKLALEYAQNATEYYEATEANTTLSNLRGMSKNAIINTWYEVDDLDRVIDEGHDLVSKYPESAYVIDAMYNIGWAHYDKKDYESSIETFLDLTERFPMGGYKADRALFQIGEAYYDQENYGDATPYYQRLVDKMRINELTDQEIQKIQRDKLAGIVDETALDLAAKAQLKVGACYANVGQFDEAATAYRRVAVLFRFDKGLISEAYQRMADMYLDKGDFELSIAAYRDAIDDVPDKLFSAKMQVLICQRYFDEGYFSEAVQEYQNYISSYSDVAFRSGFDVDEALFWLARSYYEVGNRFMSDNQEAAGRENIQMSLDTYERLFDQFPDTDLTSRIYFYQGLAYQRITDPENQNKAIEIYNTLLEEYPETPYKQYVYFFIARAYQSLEDYDSAVGYYQTIIADYPESDLDAAYMEMAVAHRNAGNEASSLPALKMVSASDPNLFTTARLLIAQYHLGQRQYREVIEELTIALDQPDAISDEHRLAQMYIMRGNANKNSDNLDESIADYTVAYDLQDPDTQETASVYRAGVYIDQGQFARAERDLMSLMNSDDENVRKSAQMRLAIISVKQDKRDQAIQTYLGMYNDTDDEDEKLNYLRNLIQLSYMGRDWERVEKFGHMMLDSEYAEGKTPEDQDFFYKEEAIFNLALASEEQDDYLKARDYLVDGFEKFPNSFYSSDMLIKVGTYYLTIEEFRNVPNAIDIAADYFDQFTKKFPNSNYTEMAHYYLGFCYYNGRRFDEAYDIFNSFAQKYAASEFTPEAIFYYADSLYNLGEMEDCIAGFDRVINGYPNHDKAQEAYYTKAWALMDITREDEAIQSLQQLVSRFPTSEFAPSSLYSIADYYYNAQEYELALENYEMVLEMFPDSEVAEKIPETLSELRETIAYLEYEKGFTLFQQAREMNDDPALYRQAIDVFRSVAEKYPFTESEIGSYSNMGYSYEVIGEWQNAVEAFDMVIRRYEEGAEVGQDAFTFARTHKDYIVANKF